MKMYNKIFMLKTEQKNNIHIILSYEEILEILKFIFRLSKVI